MSNTKILTRKSATPGAVPGSLDFGELGINYADGKLFYKNVNSAIVEFSPSVNSFGTVNANGTFVVADTGNDVLSLLPGNFINIVGDAVNDSITISANVGAIWDRANTAQTIAIAAFTQANTGGGGGGAAIPVINDTSTNTRFNILFSPQTSGNIANVSTSNTKLFFNPSTGTLSSTIFNSLSDINKKQDIVVIEEAVKKIKQIRGVQFRFIEDGTESAGIIAQEVQKVIPCLVDEQMHVNYDGLVGLLIEAIKELEERVKELENR